MSNEFECFECGKVLETRAGRNYHISVKHDIKQIALEQLKSCDSKPNYYNASKETGFSAVLYEKYFGSWNNALREAGFETGLRRNVSDTELINKLVEFYEKNDGVRYEDMNKNGPFSARLYEIRFGSWNNALEEAGLNVFKQVGENNPYWKEDSINIPYGENFKSNREKVIKRDGGCVICGKHTSDGGMDLDVHHIKPRRDFYDGETVEKSANRMDNLVTLCRTHHKNLEGKLTECSAEEFKNRTKDLL